MKLKKILKESNAPGFKDRKFGAPLPTLDSVKKAYEAKQGKDINESIGGYSRIKKPRDLSRMEGLHDLRHMKEMIKYASLLYQDMEEEGFEGAEIYDFLFYKINNTNL
jgi:hypothetical protein